MEYPEIIISKYFDKKSNKYIVYVRGISSGFIVHTEIDNSTIEFKFDASRFNPKILTAQ